MSRVENHTKHCEVCAAGYAEHCYEREAAQEFDELTAEREALRKRIEGIPDDDWQGMYHIAAKRSQEWEDKAKALQAELDAANKRCCRTSTSCVVCRHHRKEKEGVK